MMMMIVAYVYCANEGSYDDLTLNFVAFVCIISSALQPAPFYNHKHAPFLNQPIVDLQRQYTV